MTTKKIKEAKEIMKHNKVNKLYMTSDGTFFLTKNTANNHSLRNAGKKREKALKVETITTEMLNKQKVEETQKAKEQDSKK